MNASSNPAPLTTMGLLNLSNELILCTASHLSQADLLNVSLTCRHLREATEPELFRKYNYNSYYPFRRPILPFIKRLIERPTRARHVRSVRLREWTTFRDLDPSFRNTHTSDDCLKIEPSLAEYNTLTGVAKDAAIISEIVPFEAKSGSPQKLLWNKELSEGWEEDTAEVHVDIDEVDFDSQYCQALRSGIDEPLVILLMSMLPAVKEIELYSVPPPQNALPWPTPQHQFRRLERLVASTASLTLIHPLLQGSSLQTLELHRPSGWAFYNESKDVKTKVPSWISHAFGLTHLTINQPFLDHTEWKMLLEACSLTSFRLSTAEKSRIANHTMDYRTMTYPTMENPTIHQLFQLLLPFRGSLEDLYLDVLSPSNSSDKAVVLEMIPNFISLRVFAIESSVAFLAAPETSTRQYYGDGSPSFQFYLFRVLPSSVQQLVLLSDSFQDWDSENKLAEMGNMITQLPHSIRSLIFVTNLRDARANIKAVLDKIERPKLSLWLLFKREYKMKQLEASGEILFTGSGRQFDNQ